MEFDFDWDDENTKHLAAHRVVPAEFDQVLNTTLWIWSSK